MVTDHFLSILIFLPISASLLILLLPGSREGSGKWIALGTSAIQVLLLVPMLLQFDAELSQPNSIEGFQFVEYIPWFRLNLGEFGVLSAHYFVGLDGINLYLVALSVLVLLFAVIASWKVSDRRKGYFSLFLLLNGSIIGCFAALDFLLFYLFFEFMLLPMFFLIGLWGGPRRDYAAVKFFLYTLLGSVLILIVMIMLYLSVADPSATAVENGITGILNLQNSLRAGEIPANKVVHTFNMVYMTDPGNYIPGSIMDFGTDCYIAWLPQRMFGFLLLFIGFAIKVPLVPLHTWLPDAHVEAPTAISVILAGILLKVGGYGIIRTAVLIFPDGLNEYSVLVAALGVISIIYGAMNALASKDLKRLIAYSSVSHMGFVALGIASNTAEGLGGAIYQLISHGIVSAGLFLIVGVIYDRTHDRTIQNYSGLASKMPAYTVLTIIFFFASMALPGMSGFIAEILVLLGAFSSVLTNGFVPGWMAFAAVLGMILSAAYYLWTLQRMYFGDFWIKGSDSNLEDLTVREYILLVPLAIFTVLLGIIPSLLIDGIDPAVNEVVRIVSESGFELLNGL